MKDASGIRSELEIGMKMGNSLEDRGGIVGEVTLECFDSEGNLRWTQTQKNLITTFGDEYYSKQGCQGVGGNSAPTLADGMKLGTATTAVHKSSAGGANIATAGYISGSNNTFDSVTPTAVGSDSGWKITYVTTWAAGDATNSAIAEIAVVTDQETDSGSAVGTTLSRALISPTRNKQSGDTLIATWVHTFLGA